MSLSDFHLLKNTLIEAMKIERDKIPVVEESIEDNNQWLPELQRQLNVAESNLSKWESNEPWSTRRINASHRTLSELKDNINRKQELNSGGFMIFLMGIIGLLLFIPLGGALFVGWLMYDEFPDKAFLGLIGFGLGLVGVLFVSYSTKAVDAEDYREAGISRAAEEVITINRGLKENSLDSISKKRSTAKASVTRAKKKLVARENELVALELEVGNLRHKKEELIESVSHLIPYSENLS